MSAPKAPYYIKDSSDTYHWETSCSNNNYPSTGWKKTNEKPSGKARNAPVNESPLFRFKIQKIAQLNCYTPVNV